MTINEFQQLCVHSIGNKLADEPNQYSKAPFDIKNEDTKRTLLQYFTSSFKSEEFFQLQHTGNLELNEVYSYVTQIFENPEALFEQSKNICKHLFEKSDHPKIKTGELYVVFFKDCLIEDNTADAVGIFKSENREIFLKVMHQEGNFNISSDEGISISKLDKGCIIFNLDKEDGYLALLVDNGSKGGDTQYWKNDFLNLKPRNDNYHQTQNVLSLCKNFVVEKLPTEFEASKADQADMLNKSVNYFKENETFNFDEFTGEVLQNPEVIKAFNDYKHDFVIEREIEISDDFDISAPAVKKQQKIFKSVIKLDKNFHIYIHGNREFIERGYDDAAGMYFYKMFFKEEE